MLDNSMNKIQEKCRHESTRNMKVEYNMNKNTMIRVVTGVSVTDWAEGKCTKGGTLASQTGLDMGVRDMSSHPGSRYLSGRCHENCSGHCASTRT